VGGLFASGDRFFFDAAHRSVVGVERLAVEIEGCDPHFALDEKRGAAKRSLSIGSR
jgi:hypothetical protein